MPARLGKVVGEQRLPRLGHATATARYLDSKEARGITGQAINVSAGWIMH